jgi:hypothetical protein
VSRSEVPPKNRSAPRPHIRSHFDNSTHPVFGLKKRSQISPKCSGLGRSGIFPVLDPFCSSILTLGE